MLPREFIKGRIIPLCAVTILREFMRLAIVIFDASTMLVSPAVFNFENTSCHLARLQGQNGENHAALWGGLCRETRSN